MTKIDQFLGRFTMYRLVAGLLGIIAIAAFFFAAIGELSPSIFPLDAMALTLVVLVVSGVGSSLVVGRLFGVKPQPESALITSLILWLLFWPTTDSATLAWFALLGVLATVSKYALAIRKRHLFNPAAAAIVLLLLIREITGIESIPSSTWWVASQVLLPFVAVGAVIVLYRTRRLSLGIVFALVVTPLMVWGLTSGGMALTDSLRFVFYSSPLVFFAGFMLSEPLTLPPRRNEQLAIAALAGVLFSWSISSQAFLAEPLNLGPFANTYELTLIVTGAISFWLAQRGGVNLTLRERRPLGSEIYEYIFTPQRPLRFRPGQYLELDVPHTRPDLRGSRRMFSVASAPGAEVCVAIREPEPGSSLKRALREAGPGTRLRATSVHGDFVWPKSQSTPLLLIAGGIGVTPFMSQLRAHPGRDAVLVYGVSDSSNIPYRDELAELGVRVIIVSSGPAPDDLPDAWAYVESPLLTGQIVEDSVADLADRHVYISGPPVMVDAMKASLKKRSAKIRTDHFLGY